MNPARPVSGLDRFRPTLLAASGPVSPSPSSVDLTGALLFADIAGFTPLTERLAERGREGSEVLSDLLTGFFGGLIDIVIAHGGDVLALAGDALLALWDGGPGDDVESAARGAAIAALEAHRRSSDMATPDGGRIAMRTSLVAGAFSLRLLGRSDRPIPVLVGEPFASLGRLDRVGVEGRLSVGSDVAALLVADGGPMGGPDSPSGGADEADTGWIVHVDRVNVPAAPQPVRALVSIPLESVVPVVVAERVAAGHDTLLAEFRRVHVVFVNVEGLVEAPLDAQHALVVDLQAVVVGLGGTVQRLLVDDKGATLIAAFGVPGHTHEDDALRAVRVAQGAAAAIDDAGRTGGIGVAAGTAYVGPVGNARRSQYTVSGMVMNRAARLMQHALARRGAVPIGIDEATVAALDGAVATTMVERASLKGFAEPVAIHEPAGGLRDRSGPAADGLVGRDPERAIIAEAAARVAAGARALVVIRGEAGVGKSALVQMALDDLGDADVLRGAASAIENTTPYRVWRSIIATRLGVGEAVQDRQRIADAIQARTGADPAAAAALSVASGLGDPDGILGQLSPDARSRLVQDVVIRLLGEHRRGARTVVVLEDLHWADTASWLLYRRAVRELPSTLFLVTERPPVESASAPGEHPDVEHAVVVELSELDEVALAELGAAVLGVDRLPGSVVAFVRERSRGHPLFAQQLLVTLAERGLVDTASGTCRLAVSVRELETAELPETLDGLLTHRIDALSPDEVLTLQVASAIGRSFEAATVEAVHPRPEVAAQALGTLLEGDLVEAVAGGARGEIRFRHALIRDAAYGLMGFRRRRELNGSIAQWYERSGPQGSGRSARLAHHWLEADQAARAVPHLAAAGEDALGAAAYQEAIAWFTHALELDSEAANAAHWSAQLGRALVSVGRLDDAEVALHHSLALVGEPFPVGRALPAAMVRSTWHQLLNRIGRRAPERRSPAMVVRVLEDLTSVYYLSNRAGPTVMSSVQQLNVAEQLADPVAMARGYASLASTCELLLLSRAATRYEALATEVGSAADPRVAAAHLQFIGIHLMGIGGRWDEALDSFARARDLWLGLGEAYRAGECGSLQATAAILCGRSVGYEPMSAQVRDEALASDHELLEVMTSIQLAIFSNRRGDGPQAREHLRTPLRLLDAIGLWQIVWALGAHAWSLHLSADPESLDATDRCLAAMAQRRPLAPFGLDTYGAIADLGVDLLIGDGAACEPGRAAEIADRGLAQLRQLALAYRIARPRLLVALAERQLVAGRIVPATMLARRAERSAARLGMGYDEARGRLLAQAAAAVGGRWVDADVGRARSLLAEAGDVVQEQRIAALASFAARA